MKNWNSHGNFSFLSAIIGVAPTGKKVKTNFCVRRFISAMLYHQRWRTELMKLSCNCVVKDNWAVGRSRISIQIPRQNKQRWKVGKSTIPPLIYVHNFPRIFPAIFVVAKHNFRVSKQREIHLSSLSHEPEIISNATHHLNILANKRWKQIESQIVQKNVQIEDISGFHLGSLDVLCIWKKMLRKKRFCATEKSRNQMIQREINMSWGRGTTPTSSFSPADHILMSSRTGSRGWHSNRAIIVPFCFYLYSFLMCFAIWIECVL
jgi:hypothetical protein